MRNERSLGTLGIRGLLVLVPAALLLVGLLAASFVGAGLEVAPRHVPLAVTGGDAAATAVAARLDERRPGAFDVVGVADAAEARRLILDRQVYGALVTAGPQVDEVLVASAASPAVAQILSQLGQQVQAHTVTDVVPAPAEDPRGAGLAGGALPITISGILAGMLLVFLVPGARAQVVGAPVLGGAFGGVLLGVLRGGYSALTGSATSQWLAISAGVTAIALLLVGVHRLTGRVGLVVAELSLILLGNPWAAATSAPELLPEPWSTIGHRMPLGSTVDLLRGTSGFDGAGSGDAALTLAVWAGLGLVMLAAGQAGNRRRDSMPTADHGPAAVPEHAG